MGLIIDLCFDDVYTTIIPILLCVNGVIILALRWCDLHHVNNNIVN